MNLTQRSWPTTPVTEAPGTLSIYDGDNEESTGSNHQLNPTAPANQQLSNEAVSRQLADISQMLAQLTSQVAIGNTLAGPAAQGTNPPSTTPKAMYKARWCNPMFNLLRSLVGEHPRLWDTVLPQAELAWIDKALPSFKDPKLSLEIIPTEAFSDWAWKKASTLIWRVPAAG